MTAATVLAGMTIKLPLHARVVLTTKLVVVAALGECCELGTATLLTLPLLRTCCAFVDGEQWKSLGVADGWLRLGHIDILERLSRLAMVSVPCTLALMAMPLQALATLTSWMLLVRLSVSVHVTVSALLTLALKLRTSPCATWALPVPCTSCCIFTVIANWSCCALLDE